MKGSLLLWISPARRLDRRRSTLTAASLPQAMAARVIGVLGLLSPSAFC